MTDLKKISLVILVLALTALAAWPFIGGSEPFEERPPSPRPVALLAQTDSPTLTPLTAPGEATVAPVNRGSAVSPATLPGSMASSVSPLPSLSVPASKPPPMLPQNYQPLLKTQPAKPAELEPVNPVATPQSFLPAMEEKHPAESETVAPPAGRGTEEVSKPEPPVAALVTVKRLPTVEAEPPTVDPRTFPVYASTTPITATPVEPTRTPSAIQPSTTADEAPQLSPLENPPTENPVAENPAAVSARGIEQPPAELIPVAPAMPIGRTPLSPAPLASTPAKPAAEAPAAFDPTEPRRLLPAATVADASAANPLRELGEIRPLRQAFKPPVERSPTPRAVMTQIVRHRIVDGDTLESLAGRYLGNPARANEIYAMNRGVLSHPQLLPINATLLIKAER